VSTVNSQAKTVEQKRAISSSSHTQTFIHH